MKMHEQLLRTASSALSVPLSAGPGRIGVPSAVYKYRIGRSDGALCVAHLTVRVFHHSVNEAAAEIDALRRALIADGDTGIVGSGGDAIVVCGTDEGSACGYVRGTGLYFVQAGFEAEGRCGT